MNNSAMDKINKAMENKNPDMKMVIVPFMEGETDSSELCECKSILGKVLLHSEIESSRGGFNFIVKW